MKGVFFVRFSGKNRDFEKFLENFHFFVD